MLFFHIYLSLQYTNDFFSIFCLYYFIICCNYLLYSTWLMLISLKFIISDRLPKISYFSTLDYYINFSYLIMVFLIIHVCTNEDNGRVNYFKVSSIKEPDMFVMVSTVWVFVHCIVVWKYHSSNGWQSWHNWKRYLFGTE